MESFLKKYLGSIALFLIGAGSFSLIGLSFVAFMVIKDPEGFELSKMILSSLDIVEPILSGSFEGKEFVLDAAKPLKYVFFGFVGLFLVMMMVGISRAMIFAGIDLAKYASENENKKNESSSLNG